MDFIQHLLGRNGLVHPKGIDPHFPHQGEVFGQQVKAALLFADGHRVIAYALDEKGAFAGQQLPIFGPDLLVSGGARRCADPEQKDEGGDDEAGL